MEFTRSSLERAGFTGWVPLSRAGDSGCPPTGGIYVIAYSGAEPVDFPQRSRGGWFKGRDPAVSRDALVANWVAGAEVVYIGKADQLKRRLRQFADFGAGKPVGHWGGRLIWQLPHTDLLQVAWKETPGRPPVEAEAELIAEFRKAYGKPPFANEPHRLGA